MTPSPLEVAGAAAAADLRNSRGDGNPVFVEDECPADFRPPAAMVGTLCQDRGGCRGLVSAQLVLVAWLGCQTRVKLWSEVTVESRQP